MKSPKNNLEDHKKFMDDQVQPYLKPLMIDILKKRPTDILEFIGEWVKTKGVEIKKGVIPKKTQEPEHLVELSAKKINESLIEIQQAPATSEGEDDNDLLPEETPEQSQADDIRKSNTRKKLAISAEADQDPTTDTDFVPPVIPKSDDQIAQIKLILDASFMFNNLDRTDQGLVAGAIDIREFKKDELVIKQGDDGAELFIVGSGALICKQTSEGSDEQVVLREYHVGEVFGELAILYNAPRAATIIALEDSICYVLDRDTFNKIVKHGAIKKRNDYELFLNKIELLMDLNSQEKAKICDCLKVETFKKGDEIIKEGDEGKRFYLIQNGQAEAFRKNNEGQEEKVYDYKENDYFGELALLHSIERQATIRVVSEEMTVATLDGPAFNRLLGPVEDILKRNMSRYQKYVHE